MKFVQSVGVVVGSISSVAWLGILLHSLVSLEKKSLLVKVFTNRNFVNFMMVFNCLGCLAWTYGVVKTTSKNGHQFLVLSVIWLGINFACLLLLVSDVVFLADRFTDYPNAFPVVFLSIIVYVIFVTITYLVCKSLDDDDLLPTRSHAAELGNPYQPRMYVKKNDPNKKHHRRLRNDDGDSDNFMPDNDIDVPGALFADSDSDEPKSEDPNPHRHSNNDHDVSHRGHSQHDSHVTSSNHGHSVNDWPSHHSHSHETHHTPSHSTHDTHASSHFTHTSSHDTHSSSHDNHTISHDTHTSSHDTNTSTDYSCDTGGGDTGGGDTGGGDCGGGYD